LTRYFWKNFFSLLLVFVAVAEWVCSAWLLSVFAGILVPVWLHVAAPVALYFLNRSIVRRPPRAHGLLLTARRFYTGVAFTSVFGFFFLVISGALWGALWSMLQALGLVGSVIPADAYEPVARVVGTLGLLGVFVAMAWGYLLGQRKLWINRFDVPITGLDTRLDGKTIAQISDIHLGQYMTAERMAGYVERINALDADLIVITGDITDGLHHARQTFPVLASLQARMGVYAILGNHDVATGTDDVVDALREHTDFTVLCDDAVRVESDGAGFDLVGLMDRGRDWARGLQHCEVLEGLVQGLDGARPTIVLSHRPDLFAQAADLGAALVLSGHTHGGQLGIPYGRRRTATLARFMTRYPRGTYRAGDSWLHVNLGLGVTGQPVRLATPREITVITLRSAVA